MLAVAAAGLLLSKRMSVGSLLAAVSFPLLCWFIKPDFLVVGSIMALIIIIKHRANIQRLIRGEEPPMGIFKSKDEKNKEK